MSNNQNMYCALRGPGFIVDQQIIRGPEVSEISEELNEGNSVPLEEQTDASELPAEITQNNSCRENSKPKVSESDSPKEEENNSNSNRLKPSYSTGCSKQPTFRFKRELEKLILYFINVFAGGNKFKGVLACVLDDFIILINGCTIYEIVTAEIEAIEFKAEWCPDKNTNKTRKQIKKTSQEPVPENPPENPKDKKLSLQELGAEYGKASEKAAPVDQEDSSPSKTNTPRYLSRSISVEETTFTPPRVRTKKTKTFKKK
ncbi:MAG: hypothetical protein XD50_1726 [Clostridia bacterium 41_269]|nr:MAG: hypothetical protein XD50_1726 [Clostridia bacterium 41_269]